MQISQMGAPCVFQNLKEATFGTNGKKRVGVGLT